MNDQSNQELEPILTDSQVFVSAVVCFVLTLALLVAGVI